MPTPVAPVVPTPVAPVVPTPVAPVAVVTGYTASSVGTVAASGELFTFPAYVPNGYYYSWQVSQANAASVPSAALTIVANPV